MNITIEHDDESMRIQVNGKLFLAVSKHGEIVAQRNRLDSGDILNILLEAQNAIAESCK